MGFTLDEPLEATVSGFIKNLDGDTFLAARERVGGADRSIFVDENDTKELIKKFSDLSASRQVHGG